MFAVLDWRSGRAGDSGTKFLYKLKCQRLLPAVKASNPGAEVVGAAYNERVGVVERCQRNRAGIQVVPFGKRRILVDAEVEVPRPAAEDIPAVMFAGYGPNSNCVIGFVNSQTRGIWNRL